MASLQSCAEGYRIAAPARRKSSGEQTDRKIVLDLHKTEHTLSNFGVADGLVAFLLAGAARLMK
jgi:hypothetical protein